MFFNGQVSQSLPQRLHFSLAVLPLLNKSFQQVPFSPKNEYPHPPHNPSSALVILRNSLSASSHPPPPPPPHRTRLSSPSSRPTPTDRQPRGLNLKVTSPSEVSLTTHSPPDQLRASPLPPSFSVFLKDTLHFVAVTVLPGRKHVWFVHHCFPHARHVSRNKGQAQQASGERRQPRGQGLICSANISGAPSCARPMTAFSGFPSSLQQAYRSLGDIKELHHEKSIYTSPYSL